ncbi:MAG: hypothetical protein HZA01_13380 [Nitrospinae bacterium]|nr:hypothetical protein [Nitrospinota bacterium]
MKKLNLPVIKEKLPDGKVLAMDEYLEFVLFNLKHNFDRKAYDKSKKLSNVDVSFVLKKK